MYGKCNNRVFHYDKESDILTLYLEKGMTPNPKEDNEYVEYRDDRNRHITLGKKYNKLYLIQLKANEGKPFTKVMDILSNDEMQTLIITKNYLQGRHTPLIKYEDVITLFNGEEND